MNDKPTTISHECFFSNFIFLIARPLAVYLLQTSRPPVVLGPGRTGSTGTRTESLASAPCPARRAPRSSKARRLAPSRGSRGSRTRVNGKPWVFRASTKQQHHHGGRWLLLSSSAVLCTRVPSAEWVSLNQPRCNSKAEPTAVRLDDGRSMVDECLATA